MKELDSEILHVALSSSINDAIMIMTAHGYSSTIINNTKEVCLRCRNIAVEYVRNLESSGDTYCNLISIGKNKYLNESKKALKNLEERS